MAKLLKDKNDLHKKTGSGRTPLHIAAAAGNVSVVGFLLNQKGINRNARDAFGNTPLLCAAMVQHNNRDAIVKLLAPWTKASVDAVPESSKEAMREYPPATIVDFGDKFDTEDYNWTGNSIQSVTVFDLIYGRREAEPSH